MKFDQGTYGAHNEPTVLSLAHSAETLGSLLSCNFWCQSQWCQGTSCRDPIQHHSNLIHLNRKKSFLEILRWYVYYNLIFCEICCSCLFLDVLNVLRFITTTWPIRNGKRVSSRPASDQTKLSRFLGERFRTAAGRKQVAAHRRGLRTHWCGETVAEKNIVCPKNRVILSNTATFREEVMINYGILGWPIFRQTHV